jgi:hypothetical protein
MAIRKLSSHSLLLQKVQDSLMIAGSTEPFVVTLPVMTLHARVSCAEAENMAAPLSVCIKEAQRAVIHCLWAEGVNALEIHIHLCAQFGDTITS